MTVKKVYVCSCCGVERKEANHWFVLAPGSGFCLQTWEWAVREGTLDLLGAEHVCGQACAHKMLDRFMTGIEIEMPFFNQPQTDEFH
jgi:hypothetical protein